MKDYLKEYLIKIGWDFDESKIKVADEKSHKLLARIAKGLNQTQRLFLAGMTVAANATYQVAKATGELLVVTAKADREVEKLARRYWTTEQNARAMTLATEELGLSYEDLFWTTREEFEEYKQLFALSKQMEPPSGLKKTIDIIQQIQLEFKKGHILAQQFYRNVVYHLGEHAQESLISIRDSARKLFRLAQEKMPAIAHTVGTFLGMVVNFVKAIGGVLGRVASFAGNIVGEVGKLPGVIKLLIALGGLLMSGPLGAAIAAFSALMLLIDDFMVWKEGGISAYDWTKFDEAFTNLKEGVSALADSFKDLLGIFDLDVDFGWLEGLKTLVDGIAWAMNKVASGGKWLAAHLSWEQDQQKQEKEHPKEYWENYMDNSKFMGGLTEKVGNALKQYAGLQQLPTNRFAFAVPQANTTTINISTNDVFHVRSTAEAENLMDFNTRNLIDSFTGRTGRNFR